MLSTQLLGGRTLSPEELVDLLTLKENDGDQVSSFNSALEVLIRAKVSFVLIVVLGSILTDTNAPAHQEIPAARHTITLQNIWRRIYLRDE